MIIIEDLFNKKVNELSDLELLIKYLALNYMKKFKISKEKALEEAITTIEQSDNVWGYHGLAWQAGRDSLEYFCLHFLSDIFVAKDNNINTRELSNLHFELWNELSEMFIEDKWDMEEFVLSRGSSKSTTINKALACYLHCFGLSRYSLIIGKRKEDASNFVDDIKKFLAFDKIKKAFGTLIDKKNRTVNAQELELSNDSMIRAYGWETSVRGTTYGCKDGIFRPTWICCDDILNENDIKTEGAKERAINKFYKEILECGDEAVYRGNKKVKQSTKFTILGTPLAQDCFVNTIRKDPNFKVFRRSVVDFNIDKYIENNQYWQHFKKILMNTKIDDKERDILLQDYYLDNIDKMKFKTIWDGKYRPEKLIRKYFTQRTTFLQELMCDCENVGEKWFKSMRKMSREEIESNEFIKTMLCVDPASTVTKRSDYTSFVVGSLAKNGFKYVREGIIDKLSFDDYCNKVIELLKAYKEITHISIERNTFNSADVIKIRELINQDKELRNRKFTFINKHQTKNKEQKIESIIDSVTCGAIIFNEENEEFNQQFMEYSGARTSLHDDSNDVTAEFAIQIDEIKIEKGSITVVDPSSLGFDF